MGYAEEKAASERRKKAALEAAEAEFTAWYQDVGTRAERTTGGYAGANRDKIITTLPKCWCGKATAALGLCETHYSIFWRKKTGVDLGLRNRIALCHPDRPHFRKGRCYECYRPEAVRSAKYFKISNAEKNFLLSLTKVKKTPPQLGPRLAWKCDHTDRPHYGYGVCHPCCKKRSRLLKGEISNTRLPPKDQLITICGHIPDLSQGREAIIKGYCRKCYKKNQMREWRRRNRKRRKPLRLPHHPGIFCGHPERKHFAKHCCHPCYNRKEYLKPGFAAQIVPFPVASPVPVARSGAA